MDCITGKVQHDYHQATRLAKRASRSYDKPMSVYRCTACGCWHVGTAIHKPQPMRWVRNDHELRLI